MTVDPQVTFSPAGTPLAISAKAGNLQGLEIHLSSDENIPEALVEFLDVGAVRWPEVEARKTLADVVLGDVKLSGLVYSPTIELVNKGAVRLTVPIAAHERLLWDAKASADRTFVNKKSGEIRKTLVDDYPGSTGLTSGGISTSAGVTVKLFSIEKDEAVGAIFDRLKRLDGLRTSVSTSKVVSCFSVGVVDQFTVRTEDLLPTSALPAGIKVDKAAIPPRNPVTIRGPVDYSDATIQDQQNASENLTATTTYIAQRFKALQARLSGVQLYLGRTSGSDVPAALKFKVFKHAVNRTPDATRNGASWAAGDYDEDETVDSGTVTLTTGVPVTWDIQLASPEHLTYMRFVHQGGTDASVTCKVYYSDDGAAWTLAKDLGTLTATAVEGGVNAANPHIHWRFELVETGPGVSFQRREVYFMTNKQSTSRRHHPAMGPTDQTTGLVSFGDTLTIAAEKVGSPPDFNDIVEYTAPQLALTANEWYWFVLSDAGATASKYWTIYRHSGASQYADGESKKLVSGGKWEGYDYDLAFKLWWKKEKIDAYAEDNASPYYPSPYEDALPEVEDSDQAQQAADLILSKHKNPLDRVTFAIRGRAVVLDQPVKVIVPELRLNASYEVFDVRHLWTEGYGWVTIVTAGAPEITAGRAIEQIQRDALAAAQGAVQAEVAG